MASRAVSLLRCILFLALSTSFLETAAKDVNIDGNKQYENKPIECSAEEDCYVTCATDYSCYNATVVWPYNEPYSLTCSAEWSCARMTYSPYDNPDSDVHFECEDKHACDSLTFNCPSDTTCSIKCFADSACHNMTVNCPSSSFCDAYCQAGAACANATFNAIGSIECSQSNACQGTVFPIPPDDELLYVECYDGNECNGATIRCPTNADCSIKCNAPESCNNLTIIQSANPLYQPPTIICQYENSCIGYTLLNATQSEEPNRTTGTDNDEDATNTNNDLIIWRIFGITFAVIVFIVAVFCGVLLFKKRKADKMNAIDDNLATSSGSFVEPGTPRTPAMNDNDDDIRITEKPSVDNEGIELDVANDEEGEGISANGTTVATTQGPEDDMVIGDDEDKETQGVRVGE